MLTHNISETGSFINFLNGCHFEMKEGFNLNFFIMKDPINNNIQSDFYKIWSVRWKAINFFVNFTYRQTLNETK
jgi:hypothetical protein